MTADLSWLRRQAVKPPVVVAHRGASGQAPENTLPAFQLAIEQGAPCVECDVHLTTDGVPVVIHDGTVDRTTNGSGAVSSMTYAALRELDAGAWFAQQFTGTRLPTLDETLEVCAGRARLVVELKAGGGEALVDAALAAIDGARGADVAIISFGPEEVRHVARKCPDVALGFLVSRPHLEQHGAPAAIEKARELGATFFSPHQATVGQALVQASHAAGLPVSVWTVDDPERMKALAILGVDAITTNWPDVALRLFR